MKHAASLFVSGMYSLDWVNFKILYWFQICRHDCHDCNAGHTSSVIISEEGLDVIQGHVLFVSTSVAQPLRWKYPKNLQRRF